MATELLGHLRAILWRDHLEARAWPEVEDARLFVPRDALSRSATEAYSCREPRRHAPGVSFPARAMEPQKVHRAMGIGACSELRRYELCIRRSALDLIVWGSAQRSWLDRALFGSTQRRVLRRATVPVLVLLSPGLIDGRTSILLTSSAAANGAIPAGASPRDRCDNDRLVTWHALHLPAAGLRQLRPAVSLAQTATSGCSSGLSGNDDGKPAPTWD